jgi:hypothetical protein
LLPIWEGGTELDIVILQDANGKGDESVVGSQLSPSLHCYGNTIVAVVDIGNGGIVKNLAACQESLGFSLDECFEPVLVNG